MNMMSRFNRGTGLIPVTLRGVDDLVRSVLENFGSDFSPENIFDHSAAPEMEIEVDDKAITAKLPLPGCKMENISVEVQGETLTVHASREFAEEEDGKSRYVRRERSVADYEESVRLPSPVVAGEAVAKYSDGILSVTLPLEKAGKPRSHIVPVK
ncbi:MAG: Hsp20/alpha crystallin family protein [Victivallaceae bacterium]|nr:Hsp20/alpha crystallin family protein [Victivallaceae bacterium]